MKKVKRILVGIDIFTKSAKVLKRALLVAKNNNAELFIVHAVQVPWFSTPDFFGGKNITLDTQGIKKKIEKKIKALNSDTKVSTTIVVKEGNPDDILMYESKLLKIDMIIIGANTKNRKRFLGSIAEKVAYQSHLPVLIVKNKVKDTYKTILVPTDFGNQSKQSVLFAKNMYPLADFKAVYVYEALYPVGMYTIDSYALETLDFDQYNTSIKELAENNLKSFLQDVNIKNGSMIDGDIDSKEVLLNYINKERSDLIVVGSGGTSGVTSLLGSVASYILRKTSSDVLVYVP